MQQLAEEEEPSLGKQSDRYGQYLFWYARFLEQEARWDDALLVLQEAMHVFEQRNNLAGQATCLNNIGYLYESQDKLEQALDYYQRALSL